MKKKLAVIGNSLGFLIEKPILELLKMDRNTEFEVTTDGTRLILEPIRTDRKKRVRELHAKIMDKHDAAFRKLAK